MSFTSTYSSLSTRGWQGGTLGGGALQAYSLITSRTGTSIGNTSALGYAVAISNVNSPNNLSMLGAPTDSGGNGKVFFTYWGGGGVSTINGSNNQSLGGSVGISTDGNYAVATTLFSDKVYMYVANTAMDFWTEQANFTLPVVPSNFDTVAMNSIGDKVGVRDSSFAIGNITCGAVTLYERTVNTWAFSTQIYANDVSNTSGIGFGQSISFAQNNNCLAVGTETSGGLTGAVYIFNGTTQVAKIQASDGGADDQFGRSCALTPDADYLVVGATNLGNGLSTTGAAYVYANVANTWTEIAKLTPSSSTVTPVSFGTQVAVSTNSNTIVVTDRDAQVGIQSQGAAYVFTKVNSGYVQSQEILNPGANSGEFGWSLAMSSNGKSMIIGNPTDSSNGTVYLYRSSY
jgi:hypothetical protein